MKKNYLFGMALMASLAFFSCTNEVIYVHDGESSEQVSDEQIITLQVSNGGDGLTTRAGRPLYSSEAKQTIENVKVIVCNGSSVVYTKDFTKWNDSDSQEYTESGAHGRKTTIKLEGDDRLGKGQQYTVYAIGYHNSSDYKDKEGSNTLNALLSGIGVDDTFNENLTLKFTGSNNAEEIFAGSAELSISDKGAGSANVVLNRQVAGAFVYLKDIPYFDDAATLELVASSTNNQLVLGQFANTDFGSNGNNTVSLNVINGWNSEEGWTIGKAKETVIAKITLSEWFTSIENNSGLIDVANWKNKYADQSPKPTFQKGSVFAGTFLIPFAKVANNQTLKLVMKAGETSSYKVLASWNINLSVTGDNNYTNLYTWNGSTFGEPSTKEDLNKKSYSIVRNHLYGIGTRMEDDPGNGTDPDPDPTPDPTPDDEPEPLNNKQELTLRVNDNWEVIHGMELE
ncbi:hypothetical protein [Phocaeicola barnesiae]|uniref:hypothetical protein n=1 Tax=Phocaeicola barnesiae TaxID=376804 RepID=UPI00241E6C71|nr:hypothetical protein [Phocaeicola barnesiae]